MRTKAPQEETLGVKHRSRYKPNKEELERFFALSIDMLCIAGFDGYFKAVNPAWEATLGFSVQELLARRFEEFIHPDDRAATAATYAAQMQEGRDVIEFENRYLCKNGSYRWFLWNARTVPERERIYAVARDITERKRLDQELKALNKSLEARVRQRTRSLASANRTLREEVAHRQRSEEQRLRLEEQLIQAQKMEAVGQLAGGIAHDFNNILSVILNYAEFVDQDLPEGSPLKDDVKEIRIAGQRGADLVQQLLIFSRRDAGQTERVDVNSRLAEAKKVLSRTIGENIELKVRLADDLPAVNAAPGHLDQVIFNLAINARDAMPSGGLLVMETSAVVVDEAYVEQHADARLGEYVCLSISDTGHGMDRKVRERAFEPFFTTKPKGSGTGLGLASVYGVAKSAGGHVLLYSEEGRGTTVKVYLPAVGDDQPIRHSEASNGHVPLGNGETILVVEDEPAVRELTCRIMKANGYTVLQAEHPASAEALCEQHQGRIAMVLTDVVMPGASGVELSRKLREKYPGLKHLYMSGYAEDIVGQQGPLDAPVIMKPFTQTQLLVAVRHALDGGGNSKEEA